MSYEDFKVILSVRRRFYEGNIVVVPRKRAQHCTTLTGHRTIEMLGLVAPKFGQFKIIRNKCQLIVMVSCKLMQRVGPNNAACC